MDIQNWFAIDGPKEMSEAFADISSIYYAAQTGPQSESARRAIERQLDAISDPAEWFAAGMYLEVVTQRRSAGVRWVQRGSHL